MAPDHSIQDHCVRAVSRSCEQGAGPDHGAPRGFTRADDETYRLNFLGNELSVADGIDRSAIYHNPIEVDHRFL